VGWKDRAKKPLGYACGVAKVISLNVLSALGASLRCEPVSYFVGMFFNHHAYSIAHEVGHPQSHPKRKLNSFMLALGTNPAPRFILSDTLMITFYM
jgi:hypothetical protein